MCGISGFVGFSDYDLIQQMTDIVSYRGPDGSGYHVAECVSLGMRRLAIIDVTGGDQPIYNEDGSACIVYNGEVYNYREWREPLEARGHRFKTVCDTETILHLYEEYGDDCPNKLRGMFAFAIWDERKQELLLARDRLGIKPLYYTMYNGKLFFASEIKSLLAVPEIAASREVDYTALNHYLTFQYVPQPLTLFKNIFKLRPGHTLTFKPGGSPIIKPYWRLNPLATNGHNRTWSENEVLEELEALIKESVKLRLISEVPLGALLSGGIDSSLVVAIMAEYSELPVKTFTVGFEGGKSSGNQPHYDETDYAHLVSKAFGTEHHEIILKPQMTELLPRLIWHMDEPIADRAALPTYLVSQLARQSVTVALTGEGGDELFGGYPRYILEQISTFYNRFVPNPLIDVGRLVGQKMNNSNLVSRSLRKVLTSPAQQSERHLAWVGNFRQDELTGGKLYNEAFAHELAYQQVDALPLELVDSYLREASKLKAVERLGYLDLNTWLVDDILMKVDKMTMANSIEARVPLLDYKLVEYAATIPASLKVRGFTTKYALRKILAKRLPKEIAGRRKHAFEIPAAAWFRSDLKDLVRSLLLDDTAASHPYFNRNYVATLVEEHFSGRKDYNQRIWNLVCLELWHRIYIDKTMQP